MHCGNTTLRRKNSRSVTCQSSRGVNAVLDLAEAHLKLRKPASAFDADPWLLAVENGVLNLKTGSLLPHSPDHMITVAAPVRFDPSAICPTWEAHIKYVLPDADVQRTLQQWFGVNLTGDISPQAFVVAWGRGSNGKSLIFDVLRAMLGPLSGWLSLKALMAQGDEDKATGELARLRPFRAGVANETEEGQLLNEAGLKNIAGDVTIRARPNHGNPIEFRNQTKLTIVGNHLPVIRGDDDGVWRRVIFIPFDVQIPEDMRDPTVQARVMAELPGVLNWALAGLRDYLSRGQKLYIAPRIKQAVADFRGESDTLGQWFEERIEKAPGEFLPTAALYDDAKNWFVAHGFGVPSTGKLGRRLKERGETQGRGTRGERGWQGLRLRLRRG